MKTYINSSGRLYFGDAMGDDAEASAQQVADNKSALDAKAVSETAKANLTKLRVDIFPDVLAFLATLPSAPLSIRNAAVMAATEKVKVKS